MTNSDSMSPSTTVSAFSTHVDAPLDPTISFTSSVCNGAGSFGSSMPTDLSTTGPHTSSSSSSSSSSSLSSPSSSSLLGSIGNSSSTVNRPLAQCSPTPAANKHPLSNCKHFCSICGDRASGKHYGVYSCEGCKGFFKRTVRKDLTYACREERSCMIDKRQRNRCQYCRYQKCLSMGMKREAVQEERQRNKEKNENQVESTCTSNSVISTSPFCEMSSDRIRQAEEKVECRVESPDADCADVNRAISQQLFQLIEWAKNLPNFNSLSLDDQVVLLKSGWNELLIASLAHRSMLAKDCIVLANGLVVRRNSANQVGVGSIFDRVLSELVSKMRQLDLDKTELGCLRCIVLFNPEAKALKSVDLVEQIRDSVYGTLEAYTRNEYPGQHGRFAKLLLRLPALRSVALKCVDHLFFYKLVGAVKAENGHLNSSGMTVDTFLQTMLERPPNAF